MERDIYIKECLDTLSKDYQSNFSCVCNYGKVDDNNHIITTHNFNQVLPMRPVLMILKCAICVPVLICYTFMMHIFLFGNHGLPFQDKLNDNIQ